MILVIGAISSGKLDYVKSLGYKDDDISDADLNSEKKVLYNLQDLVEPDLEISSELIDNLMQKEVVICNEVGSGVIPIEPYQRLKREQTGRLCCKLAEKADKVVRMVAAIPSTIKG